MISRFAWLCVIISFFLFSPNQCYCGKLDSFENDATTHRDSDSEEKSYHYRDDEYCDDEDAFFSEMAGIATGVVLGGMVLGGISSWKRVSSLENDTDFDIEPRKFGEPFIPFFRTDISWQNVESDVEALDVRAEAGYGPIALHYNQTHYDEKKPDDELDLIRIYGVYRMSFTKYVEADLGLGTLIIDGKNENSGFSFTFPLIIRPIKYCRFEFRPAWSKVNGTSINDYDIAFLLGKNYLAFKVGYRWLYSVEESLNGPYIGVSLHF